MKSPEKQKMKNQNAPYVFDNRNWIAALWKLGRQIVRIFNEYADSCIACLCWCGRSLLPKKWFKIQNSKEKEIGQISKSNLSNLKRKTNRSNIKKEFVKIQKRKKLVKYQRKIYQNLKRKRNRSNIKEEFVKIKKRKK